jgi:hypothetical protein
MFKMLVTKVAKDLWDNAGKAEPEPSQAQAEPVAQAAQATADSTPGGLETDIEFPYYPGEGTSCGDSCRCRWDVQVRWSPSDNSNASFATWVTAGDGEVCPDCQERARAWQDVMVRVEPTA